MRVHYDQQNDALYLRFDDSDVLESEEISPGIILDFNEKKQVVGIEVLSLKERGVPLESLQEMQFKVSP